MGVCRSRGLVQFGLVVFGGLDVDDVVAVAMFIGGCAVLVWLFAGRWSSVLESLDSSTTQWPFPTRILYWWSPSATSLNCRVKMRFAEAVCSSSTVISSGSHGGSLTDVTTYTGGCTPVCEKVMVTRSVIVTSAALGADVEKRERGDRRCRYWRGRCAASCLWEKVDRVGESYAKNIVSS
jgi:hypothetical protein